MKSTQAVVADIRLASRKDGQATWHMLIEPCAFSESAAMGTLVARAASGAELTIVVVGVHQDPHGQLWLVTHKPLPPETEIAVAVGEPAIG